MNWILAADRPVYVQLVEQMELAIITGQYKPGERLPGVRDLAAEAAVNPNTMQRALQALEQRGLLLTQRTAGRTITEDKQMLQQVKDDLAKTRMQEFLQSMKALGYSKEELTALLQTMQEEA